MGRSDISKGSVSPSHIPLTGGPVVFFNSDGSSELGGCSIKGEATKPGLSEPELANVWVHQLLGEVFGQTRVQLVSNHTLAAPILAITGQLWEIVISNQS